MNTPRRAILAIAASAFALAALVAAGGCEDTDPAAQTDWTLMVSANPANIELGPNPTGESAITAVIYDKNGIVQPGIGVRFETSAGELTPDSSTTDGAGAARVTLSTGANATVTAISGSKTDTVEVKVGGINAPPTAAITLSPTTQARKTQVVTFSGASSSDTDGLIEEYQWTMVSNNPDSDKANPYVVTTTNQAVTQSFTNEQRLDITLRVTDDDGATATDVDLLNILVNIPPKAEAGPSTTGTVQTTPTYVCSVQLSGAQSVDQDGSTCPACAIATYEWQWGDGRIDRVSGTSIAQHSYRTAGSYTVNLIVYDNGEDGACGAVAPTGDPLAGCPTRKASTPDTTTVTCSAS